MSLCVVSQPIGPTATATAGLLNILSTITRASVIAANISNDSEIRDDYEVIEISGVGTGNTIPTSASRFLRNQIRICRVIRQRNDDIVWFFGSTSYLLPILFAKLIGKTVVLQPRGDVPYSLRLQWERRIWAPIARLLAGLVAALEMVGYRLSDAIVVYTPSMSEELGLDRFEHKLYSDGARYVDTDRFYPRVPYDERGNVVGFLGRLDDGKGLRELVRVCRLLPDDVTFVFAGDGAQRDYLEKELASEIESGAVEMTGWVERDRVPDVLSRFKLLVLPSQMEGLPTVILEALSCGTPVYATPVSGVPDVVTERETGMLMENRDPELIAKRITEFLRDADTIEISESGRDLIETTFDHDAAVERYRSILSEIDEG